MAEVQADVSMQVEEAHAPEIVEHVTDALEEKSEVAVGKEEGVKEKKKRGPRVKKAKAPTHPPYFQMIEEAITSLNEKAGSSPYAIAKYMENNHKSVLPSNFRKTLGLQLKKSVTKGNLVKIRASYKLSEAGKKKDKPSIAKTKAVRANAASVGPKLPKETTRKGRKPKSKAISMIDDPPTPTTIPSVPTFGASTRGRRSKRSGPVAKPKQLKSIKSSNAKKAKKSST